MKNPHPNTCTNYVQEMVECGVQLTQMLEHMYRFRATNPDSAATRRPEVLRDLVASTFQPSFRTSKREVERATDLLRVTSTHHRRGVPARRARRLRRPRASDFEGELDLREELPDLYGDDDLDANGSYLH